MSSGVIRSPGFGKFSTDDADKKPRGANKMGCSLLDDYACKSCGKVFHMRFKPTKCKDHLGEKPVY